MPKTKISFTLGTLLDEARRRLSEAKVDDPALEARVLVEHFTGTKRIDSITRPASPVETSAVDAVLSAIEQRREGMPIYRSLGYREFYGLKLLMSPETLEPRPDTETLVELALPVVQRIAEQKGGCRILDLGTGTGAIALALLSVVERSIAVGTDISREALATARRNSDIHGLGARFTTLLSNWLESVDGRYDIIISNPPYISAADMETLPREVRQHDPEIALDGGSDGLLPYREIASGAHKHLSEVGLIALETGYDQKEAVAQIFAAEGYTLLSARRDLGGRDRAMLFAPAASGWI
ncbi:peptide chain release factor N(5)-glutamine methyltransferase [Chelativorans sp. Marseille-P2723]|uniref:peptide chain release factor N(5)-glutamine methyltransferase n=1 Tax=Chelativorans sp. Marseille-P2723 TaxID=2709133 RepID=UPI001FF03952|nr:peptide chain release factor N(5)-glutamine methyltransferase [Chelativorans sp. Marseille-P2723]